MNLFPRWLLLSEFLTLNTLFCNSSVVFAYGLSQHYPLASPKLEIFSTSRLLCCVLSELLGRFRAQGRLIKFSQLNRVHNELSWMHLIVHIPVLGKTSIQN